MAEESVSTEEMGDLWEQRDELARLDWEARRYWATLDNPHRAGLALLVRDSMLRLLRDIDEWLPSSVSGTDVLYVRIGFQLPEVEAAALSARVRLERQQIEQGRALMALVKELTE